MSRTDHNDLPPLALGALLRFALHEVRARIFAAVADAGFDDVRPVHVTLFRWPGPEGRRPTEIAADAQISKQAVNDRLRDLERLGYLECHSDPTDDRARIVRLTARGRALHRVAIDVQVALEAEWAQQVGEERFAQMRATLRDMVREEIEITTQTRAMM
jgi:DNA-binding MarR family transcriptional regulator